MSLPIHSKKEVFRGQFLSVWATKFSDKVGGSRVWEWVKKKDVVVIFPITTEGKVVLIKSFRVPLEKYVIELPAGLVDGEDESPEDVARRELMEETGYRAERIEALPPTPYAAGTSNNLTHNFIATNLSKVSEGKGDITEDITILEIPLTDLMQFYLHNHDTLFNLKILALHQIATAKGLLPK